MPIARVHRHTIHPRGVKYRQGKRKLEDFTLTAAMDFDSVLFGACYRALEKPEKDGR